MKLALSPRAKRYAKRFGIAGAIIGFLPLGMRAIMLAGDYFTYSPDRTDLGEMLGWTTVIVFGAAFQAAVAGAVGAVIGIGVAIVIDRRGGSVSMPSLRLSELSPRTKTWGMWGAILFAVLGIIAFTYQMLWPIPELQDPRVEALPLAGRITAYALQLVKAIVIDAAFGWALGAGAGAIVTRMRAKPESPSSV